MPDKNNAASNPMPDMVKLIIEGIQERKGKKISYIDLSDIESAATSGFIICQGTSSMQVSAIADSVREYLLEHAGIKPYNYPISRLPLPDALPNILWMRVLLCDFVIWEMHTAIRHSSRAS